MKTTIKLSIIALLAAFTLSSCSKTRIKGSGPTITENFNYSNFSKVDVAYNADVNYIYDNDYSVEVSAQENVIDAMDIEKNGSTICLKFKRGTTLVKYDKIRVTIHSPEFDGANVSGSGDLYVQGNYQSTSVNLDVSGSGKIDIQEIQSTNVEADISGSGKIEVHNGSASSLSTRISGSGKMYFDGMEADDVDTRTSGSGKTMVWANDNLDVRISGSGDVYYKGNPTINSDISGSGKLHSL